MNIHIEDPNQWLTKTQKMKIRAMYRDKKDKKEILDHIHYTQEKKYHDFVEKKKEENSQDIYLCFTETSEKDKLKQKLHMKLKNKEIERNNQYKDEAWKKYHEILNHPSIRCLPDETIEKGIPNPDQIKSQKDVYRMINKMNPNPFIKSYIDECLRAS